MRTRLLVCHPLFSSQVGSGLGERQSPRPGILMPSLLPYRAPGQTGPGKATRTPIRDSWGRGPDGSWGGVLHHPKSSESLATGAWEPSPHPACPSSTPPPLPPAPPAPLQRLLSRPHSGSWKWQGANAPEANLHQRWAVTCCVTAPASSPHVLDGSGVCVPHWPQRSPVGLGSCCPQPLWVGFLSLSALMSPLPC